MTLYIVGAGGFGRETYDAVLAERSAGICRSEDTLFADDAKAGSVMRGLRVTPISSVDDDFVVAIADPSARRRIAGQLEANGLSPRTIVHPSSTVAPETVLGQGTVVLANTYVSSSCSIGKHVQINYNATVGHDTVLGDYATIFPGANVAGSVRIADHSRIGSNACVLQGLSLAAGTFVGAGAVVTRSVNQNHAVLVGVPARVRNTSELR